MAMEVKIVQSGSGKLVATLSDLSPTSTIQDVKKQIYKIRKNLHPGRQALRLDSKGKFLADNLQLNDVEFLEENQLFLKDLGPQIGWKTVFLFEYAGPLVLYLVTYCRPEVIYGANAVHQKMHTVVHIAAACWTAHYVKRLFETLFIHRFSHSTMPIRNLFKNCSYYWMFGLFIGYYINHPLYTVPYFGKAQIYGSLAVFILSELGNLSIHLALRNLRPAGSTERKIPRATSNPFTWLFNLVSCPNYSYEFYAWLAFSTMTQSLPAGIFTIAGFYQMAVWAIGKHKNYRREFPNYPKSRKAIIPFTI